MLQSGDGGGTQGHHLLCGCEEVDAALLTVETVLPFRFQA